VTVLRDYLGEESAFGLNIELFCPFRLILITKPTLQNRSNANNSDPAT
jgi:hypothetical protein